MSPNSKVQRGILPPTEADAASSPRRPIYPCHAARKKCNTMGIPRDEKSDHIFHWWVWNCVETMLVLLLQCEKSSTINGFVSNSLLIVEMKRVSTRDNMLFEWAHNMLCHIRTCIKKNYYWPAQNAQELLRMPKNCSGPWQESAITTISLTKQITVSRHGLVLEPRIKISGEDQSFEPLGQCEQHNVKIPKSPGRNPEKINSAIFSQWV